jgi:hypothetical protein
MAFKSEAAKQGDQVKLLTQMMEQGLLQEHDVELVRQSMGAGWA